MKPMNDRKLVRKLALVLAVKLVLLFALWWAFFRGQQVAVDAEHALPAFSSALSPSSPTRFPEEPPHAQ